MVVYSDSYDFYVDYYNTSHYFYLRYYIFYALIGNIIFTLFSVFPFLNLNISRCIWWRNYKGQSFLLYYFIFRLCILSVLGLFALNEYDGQSHENTIYENFGLFSFIIMPLISVLTLLLFNKIVGDLRFSLSGEVFNMSIHEKKLIQYAFYKNAIKNWSYYEIKRFNENIQNSLIQLDYLNSSLNSSSDNLRSYLGDLRKYNDEYIDFDLNEYLVIGKLDVSIKAKPYSNLNDRRFVYFVLVDEYGDFKYLDLFEPLNYAIYLNKKNIIEFKYINRNDILKNILEKVNNED